MKTSNRARVRPWVAVWLLAPMLVAIPGCSDELESPTARKLRALGTFYLDYAIARKGQGVANEQDFKKYMRAIPDHIFSTSGVKRDEIDGLFNSERDNEPFVVLYGQKITEISGKSGSLIAHEKNGKNGKRLVVLSNTKVELVDEARLQELLPKQ